MARPGAVCLQSTRETAHHAVAGAHVRVEPAQQVCHASCSLHTLPSHGPRNVFQDSRRCPQGRSHCFCCPHILTGHAFSPAKHPATQHARLDPAAPAALPAPAAPGVTAPGHLRSAVRSVPAEPPRSRGATRRAHRPAPCAHLDGRAPQRAAGASSAPSRPEETSRSRNQRRASPGKAPRPASSHQCLSETTTMRGCMLCQGGARLPALWST